MPERSFQVRSAGPSSSEYPRRNPENHVLVLVTGYAMDAGMDAYLPKPFDAAELKEVIGKVTGDREGQG